MPPFFLCPARKQQTSAKIFLQARFMANGRCGYVLKPLYMLDETFRPDLSHDKQLKTAYPIDITIQIVAGKHLSRKDHNKGICSPFVELNVLGLPTDTFIFRTASASEFLFCFVFVNWRQ